MVDVPMPEHWTCHQSSRKAVGAVIPSTSEGSLAQSDGVMREGLCDPSAPVRSLTVFGMTERGEIQSRIVAFNFDGLCLIFGFAR